MTTAPVLLADYVTTENALKMANCMTTAPVLLADYVTTENALKMASTAVYNI